MKKSLLILALTFSACGKKSEEPIATPSAKTDPTSAATEPDRAATLNQLTQALRKFSAEQRRVPISLDELVTAGYLPEIPAAPAGKKYVFDDQLRVTLK